MVTRFNMNLDPLSYTYLGGPEENPLEDINSKSSKSRSLSLEYLSRSLLGFSCSITFMSDTTEWLTPL